MRKLFSFSWLVLAISTCSATAVFAYEPVDTDRLGAKLAGDHFVADISANGRYVLLTNFDPANASDYLGQKRCRVLRKDRQTGDVVAVFRSNSRFDYCAAVRISATGRYVAAAPGHRLDETENACEPTGVPVQALQVKDVVTGDVRRVWKRWQVQNANDCARIDLGNGAAGGYYPARQVYAFSGNGNVAITRELGVYGNTVGFTFELYDAETGARQTLSPDGSDTPAISSIRSLAISHKGTRVAMAVLDANLSGPGDILTCGQTGRCEPASDAPVQYFVADPGSLASQYDKQVVSVYDDRFPVVDDDCGSWWQCPQPQPEPTVSIRILNRDLGTLRSPAALRQLSPYTSLDSGGWSLNGKRLSWIEYPDRAVGRCIAQPGDDPICENVGCSNDECELLAQTYWFKPKRLRSKRTAFDSATLSSCFEHSPQPFATPFVSPGVDCTATLSRNGNYLLYPRAVRYPFGNDWQPNSLAFKDFACVDRLSLEQPGFEPEEIECPDVYPDSGPIIGIHYWDTDTDFANPVIWHLRDLREPQAAVVARISDSQLVTTTRGVLSRNGKVLAFASRDPLAAGDAADTDESCRWSPANSELSISLATHDTTKTVSEDDFVVYPATPTLCAVPETKRPNRIIAGEAPD